MHIKYVAFFNYLDYWTIKEHILKHGNIPNIIMKFPSNETHTMQAKHWSEILIVRNKNVWNTQNTTWNIRNPQKIKQFLET